MYGAECPEGVAALGRQGRLRMSLSEATESVSLIDLNNICTYVCGNIIIEMEEDGSLSVKDLFRFNTEK